MWKTQTCKWIYSYIQIYSYIMNIKEECIERISIENAKYEGFQVQKC